jgi:hypothetical protein
MIMATHQGQVNMTMLFEFLPVTGGVGQGKGMFLHTSGSDPPQQVLPP